METIDGLFSHCWRQFPFHYSRKSPGSWEPSKTPVSVLICSVRGQPIRREEISPDQWERRTLTKDNQWGKQCSGVQSDIVEARDSSGPLHPGRVGLELSRTSNLWSPCDHYILHWLITSLGILNNRKIVFLLILELLRMGFWFWWGDVVQAFPERDYHVMTSTLNMGLEFRWGIRLQSLRLGPVDIIKTFKTRSQMSKGLLNNLQETITLE